MQGMSMSLDLLLFLRLLQGSLFFQGFLPVYDILNGISVTAFAQLVTAEYALALQVDIRNLFAGACLIPLQDHADTLVLQCLFEAVEVVRISK
jgi:hypothetical protein